MITIDVSMTDVDAVDDDDENFMYSGSSSNISETDSRSSSTAVAGGGSRKRSRKDTASSGKSSHDCRRLSQRIAQALRRQKLNVSDSDTVGRDDVKDETDAVT